MHILELEDCAWGVGGVGSVFKCMRMPMLSTNEIVLQQPEDYYDSRQCYKDHDELKRLKF